MTRTRTWTVCQPPAVPTVRTSGRFSVRLSAAAATRTTQQRRPPLAKNAPSSESWRARGRGTAAIRTVTAIERQRVAEIPNSKFQAPNNQTKCVKWEKSECHTRVRFLSILAVYDLFGIWILALGISALGAVPFHLARFHVVG